MEGFLYKKGTGDGTFGRKSWKKRWFVLEDGYLFYYENLDTKSDEAVSLKGKISIEGCLCDEVEHHTKKFAFKIGHESDATRKEMIVHADDEKSQKQWVSAINSAIHTIAENAAIPPISDCLILLGLENTSVDDESKFPQQSEITRAYRKACLKYLQKMMGKSQDRVTQRTDGPSCEWTGKEGSWLAYSDEN